MLLGSENKKNLRASTQNTIHPLTIQTTALSTGLCQYDSPEEYCA